MKKFSTAIVLAALALSLAACGGKKAENVQTQAAQAAEQKEEAEEEVEETEDAGPAVELPEEYESLYFEGEISDMSSRTISVTNESGESMTFDITAAESSEDTPMLTGCYVEVEYAELEGEEKPAAVYISVLMDIEELAQEQDRDPVLFGTLQIADINELVVLDDCGEEHTFDNQMSRVVTFDELKAGDRVAVTYGGNLFGETEDAMDPDAANASGSTQPYAVKVVEVDALNTEEGQANYITGQIDAIYADVFEFTTDLATYQIQADAAMLEGIEAEDMCDVYYTGSLNGISVIAERIEKF